MMFGPAPTAAELFAEGARHHQAGRMADAERCYRQAIAADPRHADALHWLGVMAGEAGRPDVALQLIDRAIAVQPLYSEAHTHRAVTLLALGRMKEAADSYRKAVSQKKDNVEAWYGLGGALRELNQLDESASAYRRAIALRPRWAEAHNNLGVSLQKHGKFDEAAAAYRAALALAPDYPQMHYNLGSALMAQRDLPGALACFDKALALDPGYAEALGNRLLCLTYSHDVSPQALLDAHREWDRRYGARAAPQPHANDRDPERRLRIGLVSGDFQTHPIGYFLTKALEQRDRAAVEVFCYSNDLFTDAVTARLQALSDHWRVIAQTNDEQAAAAIRQDRIDILIDLSGHTDKNRLSLFALKPAPVQASWLGYPGTIGLAAIDYLIMDPDTVPPGAEAWCAEAVARLPHGRFCYAPPDYAPGVTVPPPGPVTFGSFNNVTKVGPEVVALWARVLRAVPGSRLLLKWKTLGERSIRHKLRAEFAAAGIDKNHVEWRGSTPHPKMLAEYAEVDIALDPFPFCGGLTSAEALWMGVPVVTLPGDRPASRQTLGFLNQIGLGELAATSEDDYVRIAAELAAAPARRADLRRGMRARMIASPMCDGALQARGLEAAFRTMWRRWCAGEAPTTFDA